MSPPKWSIIVPSLADVNVILPLAVEGHVAANIAYAWWNAQPERAVVLCLPVKMAILRHLTNRAVIGSLVMEPEKAWAVVNEFENDSRMAPHEIPAGIDSFWLAYVRGRKPSPNLWTDAWLAAFAESAGLEMVTFDKGFRQFNLTRLKILKG